MVQSALLLLEMSKGSAKPTIQGGGVFQPGAAFDGTDLPARLTKAGVNFDVLA